MKKKKRSLLFAVTLIMAVAIPTIASAAWSGQGTYSVSRGDDWKSTTTTGDRLMKLKTSNATTFDVQTLSLTMWNNPFFRLVNSDNVARSEAITTGNTGNIKSGNSTATNGYNCYGSVKPSALQTGTDTILLKFDPKYICLTKDASNIIIC